LPTRPTVSFVPAAPGRPARRRALYAFAALAALLHLALLGAIVGSVGLGSERRATAAVVGVHTASASAFTVRTIATEVAPAEPAGPTPPPVSELPSEAASPTFQEQTTRPSLPQRRAKASTRLPTSADVPSAVDARQAAAGASTMPPEQTSAGPAMPAGEASAGLATPASEATTAVAAATVPPVELDAVAEPTAGPTFFKVALDAPGVARASFLAAGELPPPTYRTLLPAPAILRYELRRGILRGTGEIRWRPAGDRYALQFEARLAGLTLLAQSSQGELDAHGLAPVRFVDQRARKPARAVNFSRDLGTISFSGSTARWPLLAGSQDRLSWMIQLGGIVAAEPAIVSSGRISMVLVSARGEASVRTARFAGRENAETGTGSVPALKFVIDGHSAYDGSFEIWLDPARGYLPARAVSRASSGDAEFELLLQRADP
jgi:hypothetical protein